MAETLQPTDIRRILKDKIETIPIRGFNIKRLLTTAFTGSLIKPAPGDAKCYD